MLFVNVYDIESFSSIQWDLVLYACAAVMLIFLLGLISTGMVTKKAERRGVLLQCTFRSNLAIIGLPLAASLGGAEAEAVAAVISAFTIPVFNVLAVIALTVFTGEENRNPPGIGNVLKKIVTNPLIIGVASSLFFLGLRAAQGAAFGEVVFSLEQDMKFLYKALGDLKKIASPLALLVLGGQFQFSAVKGMGREIAAGTFWRLILAPVIGIGGAILLTQAGILRCGADAYPALIALFGSPVAVSSAVMAGQMDGDEQLATQLVVWTSLCSIFTVFALVCLMIALGMLSI
jgi:predicted permease